MSPNYLGKPCDELTLDLNTPSTYAAGLDALLDLGHVRETPEGTPRTGERYIRLNIVGGQIEGRRLEIILDRYALYICALRNSKTGDTDMPIHTNYNKYPVPKEPFSQPIFQNALRTLATVESKEGLLGSPAFRLVCMMTSEAAREQCTRTACSLALFPETQYGRKPPLNARYEDYLPVFTSWKGMYDQLEKPEERLAILLNEEIESLLETVPQR